MQGVLARCPACGAPVVTTVTPGAFHVRCECVEQAVSRALGPLYVWRDESHRSRCLGAYAEYKSYQEAEPDGRWQRLLYLLTATPGLWREANTWIAWIEGSALLPDVLPRLSRGEAALYDLARSMYYGRGGIDLVALAESLEPELWTVATWAILLWRAEIREGDA